MGGFMTEEQKRNEAMRLKDAEILARRKQKFDAARFSHIESTNKVHGAPKPHAVKEERDWKKDTEAKLEEQKKKGWRIFKKKDTDSEKELVKESTKVDPPIAARSEKPEGIPVEMAPNWAGHDQKHQKPQPNYGHSSDANFGGRPGAPKIVTHVPEKPRPKPDPKKPMYNTVGYGANGVKSDGNISSTIAAFQKGFKPITGKPRNMKKEKVISSQSETMDNQGNITRTITKKITDPATGKTRTETEVIKIPAKR